MLISVFAHGLTAQPLAARYGGSFADAGLADAGSPAGGLFHMPSVQGLLRRHRTDDLTGEDGDRGMDERELVDRQQAVVALFVGLQINTLVSS